MRIINVFISLRKLVFTFMNFFICLERLRNEDIYSYPDNFPTGFYFPKGRKYAGAFQITFSTFIINFGFGGVENEVS